MTEPPIIAPLPAPETWEGAYGGITAGTRMSGDMTYTPGPSYPSLEPGRNVGLFGGYNVQNGKLVFGGEVAYSRASGYGPVGFPTENFTYFLDGKLRAGLATDRVLFYGFAGYTTGSYESSPVTWNVSGANYGIGVDALVNDNFFLGGEFIIRNLSGDTNIPGQVQDTTIRALQLRAGWKF